MVVSLPLLLDLTQRLWLQERWCASLRHLHLVMGSFLGRLAIDGRSRHHTGL
jgi:hypothetical protein